MKLNQALKSILICGTLLFSSISFSQSYKTKKAFQDAGDILEYALPFGSILTTIVINDKKGTWQFAKAFGTNLAITYALKFAINKPRPGHTMNGKSFPSGHTSGSFQSASFIQRRYGWKYGLPAYVVAGFVGYSRIWGHHQKHDGWDVLAGAILGIGSTYLFTTPYQKEHFELALDSGENNYSIGFKYKF